MKILVIVLALTALAACGTMSSTPRTPDALTTDSTEWIPGHIADPDIDFVSLAGSMGLQSRRVDAPQDFSGVLREAIASRLPNLIDVRVANGFGG